MLLLRPRGAGQPRGHRQQAALKEQRFRGARSSSLSIDSRARGPRRPSKVGQPSDPQSDRPAGAACWPPSPLTMGATHRQVPKRPPQNGRARFQLGANDGARAIGATADAAAAAGRPARFSYRVIAQHAALKLRQFRGRVPPLYPLTRAHEGRADPAKLVSRATRNQTDPPAPPAGRRRHLQWALPIDRSQRDHPKTEGHDSS